jgi:hypothetical protein
MCQVRLRGGSVSAQKREQAPPLADVTQWAAGASAVHSDAQSASAGARAATGIAMSQGRLGNCGCQGSY